MKRTSLLKSMMSYATVTALGIGVICIGFAVTEVYSILAYTLVQQAMITIKTFIIIGILVFVVSASLSLCLFIKLAKKILGI